MEDRCVICGDIIPEGRMVCPKCEYKYRYGRSRSWIREYMSLIAVCIALVAVCIATRGCVNQVSAITPTPTITREAHTEPPVIPTITLSPTPTEAPICPTNEPQRECYEVVDEEYKQLLEYEYGTEYEIVVLMSYEYVSFYLGCVNGEWVLVEYCFG